jgi:hypothetical protein
MENMPVSYVPHGDSPGSNDNIPPVSSAPRPGAGGFGRHRAGTDHATVPPRDGPTEPSASLIRPSLGVESNGFLRVTCSCSEEPGPVSQRGFWRTRGCGLGCHLPEIKPPSASLYDLFCVFLLPPAPAPRPKTTHVTPEVTPRGGSIFPSCPEFSGSEPSCFWTSYIDLI